MNAWFILGAVILLFFEIIAALKMKKLITLLIYSSLAEVGFVLLGIGSGTFFGQTGGFLHLEYQILMRALVFFAAFIIIKQRGTQSIDKIQGFGRTSPFIATMFAFGIFSVMGLSPFKGSISKFLIVYSCIESSDYFFATIAIVGSIIEAWYFIKLLHRICFAVAEKNEEDYVESAYLSLTFKKISYGTVIMLGALTALAGLFPEPLIGFSEHLATLLFGSSQLELPVFESPWPTIVLVPYIGAFIVFVTGHFLPRLRGLLATGIGVATIGIVWMDGRMDGLSKFFALIISVISVLVIIYSIGFFQNKKHSNGFFFFLFLTMGSIIGVATSTEFGDFYVFWELMTWASYLLIVIHEPTKKALNAGFLYFMMCTSGAYIMQYGIFLLQKNAGTLSLDEVSSRLPMMEQGLLITVIVLIIIGVGVKAGLMPMHSWLPKAYAEATSPVSAILAATLTKIGVYGLIRILFAVFGVGLLTQLGSAGNFTYTGLTISILGIITSLYGEIMALRQKDMKRLLAYSSMGQIGEIIAILGLGTYLSMVAGLYHVLNHAIMKGLLFLAAGILVHKLKSRNITELKGAGKAMPITAGCLSIGILAIIGLPPFNGFISKFLMLYAAVEAGYWYIAALLLFGSILAAIYFIRLIKTIFFEKYEGTAVQEDSLTMLLPIGLLTGLVVFNGLFPQYALKLVEAAAKTVAEKGGLLITSIPQIEVSWPVIIIIPMVGSLLAFFLGKRSAKTAGWISVAVMSVTLVAIALSYAKLDLFSFCFAMLIAFVGLLNILFSLGYMGHGHAQNRYYMFFIMMIAGLIGVATSKDFYSFFIYWEIMSSWTLYFSIIHEETKASLKEGFKYFVFNYIGASVAFLGILILTAETGTFDMAVLAERLKGLDLGMAGLSLALLTVGFLMKAAVLPFRIDYQMHPATAPTPVSGYISSVLLKSAPFGLIKLFFIMGGTVVAGRLGSVFNSSVLLYIVSWVAGLTIIGAGAMALVQRGIKRMLIYSTVSQIGYIILGLSLGTTLGLTGAMLHFVNHMFFKNLLFLAAGAIMVQAHVKKLDDVSGLGKKMPVTLAFFMIGALSLAGIPPFSGFTSKWVIYEAAMESGQVFLAILSLAGSAMTMAYFIKFMHSAFFGAPTKNSEAVKEAPWTMLVPMGVLSGLSLVLGIIPGLSLKVISKVLSLVGIEEPQYTWFSIDTPIGVWQVGIMTMVILLAFVVGLILLLSGSKKIRYTDAYTCGVTDLDGGKTNTDSQNMYETPTKLVRTLHKKLIVPVFGNGEEDED